MINIDGDLFDSTAEAIGQGVNTKGLMGAGIAKKFSSVYPEMYSEYRDICRRGDLNAGHSWNWFDNDSDDIVLNIASQNNIGADARISWLISGTNESIDSLRQIRPDINRIALPRIGCGIGGLDWKEVSVVLKNIAREKDIDIEIWSM